MSVPTAHNTAKAGEFAPTVLLPGDPLRAQFIAETYLASPKLVNPVRGVNGYTGLYQGKPVSVMASGMGSPSMGIYSHELFAFYGVRRILRIGTAGAIAEDLQVGDVVLGMGACTNSNFLSQFQLPGTFAPIASYPLLQAAVEKARELNIPTRVGNLFSSDTFYDDSNSLGAWQKMGVLAVEMESAALYANAARLGGEALCICTISDCPFTGASASAEERQTGYRRMMELALALA